ncbi:MAG: hypothetical protein AAB116_22555, partial [Candidatus Poribacteria bacterium]
PNRKHTPGPLSRGEFKSIPPLKKGDKGGFKYIFMMHKSLKIGKLFNHESLVGIRIFIRYLI